MINKYDEDIIYFSNAIIKYLNDNNHNYNYFSQIIIELLIKSYGKDSIISMINKDNIFINNYPSKENLDYVIYNLNQDKNSFDYYYCKAKLINKLLYMYSYSDYEEKSYLKEVLDFLEKTLDGKLNRYKHIRKDLESRLRIENTSALLDKMVERKEGKRR